MAIHFIIICPDLKVVSGGGRHLKGRRYGSRKHAILA